MSDPSAPVYAHTVPGRPPADWELLSAHAAAVAGLATTFAAAFGAADWGHLAGRWHDLGKSQREFQEYLHGRLTAGPPHAWEFGHISSLTIPNILRTSMPPNGPGKQRTVRRPHLRRGAI